MHFYTGYATLLFGQFHKNITGVKSVCGLDLVKRETGESPVRARRCNKGVLFIAIGIHESDFCCEKQFMYEATGKPGRQNKMVILEPEDLPVMR